MTVRERGIERGMGERENKGNTRRWEKKRKSERGGEEEGKGRLGREGEKG